jgi:hypothetical protein
MSISSSPSSVRYRCQIGNSCELFSSPLGVSECYERGGHLVRSCSESSGRVPDPGLHPDEPDR